MEYIAVHCVRKYTTATKYHIILLVLVFAYFILLLYLPFQLLFDEKSVIRVAILLS